MRHNYIIFFKWTVILTKSLECNWVFNVGEILKIETDVAVTIQTIKNGDQT